MAKSHYSVKKRRKEMARKLKQEEKRQRKLGKDSIEPEEALDMPQDPEEAADKTLDEVKDPIE